MPKLKKAAPVKSREASPSIRVFNHQKANDADAVSQFSQALDQVRSGAGALLKNQTPKLKSNPLLAKKKSVVGTDHARLRQLIDKNANATANIFETMQQEKPISGGRL